MVGFHFPNILHRKSRPRTTGDSSSPAEECNSPQQSSQQSDSQNPPGLSTQNSSWPSSELSSALPSRPGAIAPPTPLSSPTSGATTSRTKNASNRNKSSTSKNNNIRRRPASVKRKSSDSTSRARTPTRNTDLPIPTIIHPSTPLPRPSLSSRSRSSTRPKKSHLTRHPSQRKPILKLPTTAVVDDNAQGRISMPYTSQADTRLNTERNTFITRYDTATQNELGEMSPSARRRRESAPSPMSAINFVISLKTNYHKEPYGYEDGGDDGEREREGEGKGKGKGAGAGAGAATGTSTGTSRRSRSSSSHRSKHNNEQKQKKRKREKKKMVRFDHVDVHPYEVERGEESRFRLFSRRAAEGGVEAIENEGGNENENGRVGNRGEDVAELEMDLDLREYVMDIPDVIQG
ncbi:hypothetical protein, variant 2 [Blastomyces dermatitidis ER-3]|uniref:Uncharacterized protein n=2 Tax=Blastomyces TaxID=229219 RepID=A0A179U875_BLAGS|nr:hypothetical protein, variant 2 [Blastomyces gilchristii SLH14081]XP_031576040.1 uncharacterized protein BDBG_00805 [Blastomyces gilchristii SLH14081]XP_031576041.1 hypothetical protein, variant 1 [Blastomyces gilchristii SLH14081]XP_045277702.1 uncharacterized protein BDCG_06224 [Blastomyces dermatitidis ER-3]XP_045281592.1 hypothetical protein, variant 1 [Blastomyces dermatitidis ER-3]XP_045281593.1 hypothetical protein, variant 2 [Blastomyces dermatitidis ER-3]EEQ91104.1 hypothetical pr